MTESTIAILISLVALLVSIFTPAFEYWWNKKMNKANLSADYYLNLYGKHLFDDMPKAREFLHFSDNELSGVDKLIEVLREIRTKSLYFKKRNNSFYKKLCENLQNFEDYLVSNEGKMSQDKFIDFSGKVNTYMCDISDLIFENYTR